MWKTFSYKNIPDFSGFKRRSLKKNDMDFL